MSGLPNCPECGSDLTYTDGTLMICPMCSHEWTEAEQAAALEAQLIKPLNATARTAIPKSFFIFIPPIFSRKKLIFCITLSINHNRFIASIFFQK